MITIQNYTETDTIGQELTEEITKFLFEHLEQYGDPQSDIADAVGYALGSQEKPGGTIVTATDQENKRLVGAVVINKTGMGGYIPENILVYIATDKNVRGQGIGKRLMQNAIENSEGDIALHCEPENPAMHLYKKLGFTNKYLEMRLKK